MEPIVCDYIAISRFVYSRCNLPSVGFYMATVVEATIFVDHISDALIDLFIRETEMYYDFMLANRI
jgi:hypothetical protein